MYSFATFEHFFGNKESAYSEAGTYIEIVYYYYLGYVFIH
jgi:hypothetical protein